jgi:hypothetical protein
MTPASAERLPSRWHELQRLTRRHFLRESSAGIGAVALAALAGRDALGDALVDRGAGRADARSKPLDPKRPHAAPRAERVIYLHLTGSPPHLDLYDYKPELVRLSGQTCPDSFLEGKRFAFTSGKPKLLGTPRTFTRHGDGGVWLSDAVPNLHRVADKLCVIRSMTTDQFNHAPAELLLYTG